MAGGEYIAAFVAQSFVWDAAEFFLGLGILLLVGGLVNHVGKRGPVGLAAAGLLAICAVAFVPVPRGDESGARASAAVDSRSAESASIDFAAVTRSARQTVKIIAGYCRGNHGGSGFPISSSRIITNAHVVVGSGKVTVSTVDGRSGLGTVVVFDPERDVAIIAVPDLQLTPLAISTVKPEKGSTAIAMGFPNNGPESLTTGAIDRVDRIQVPNIYGRGELNPEVVVTRAQLQPGNSGGPLVDGSGRVLGLVFAGSPTGSSVAYALSNREIEPDLRAALNAASPVMTGTCASQDPDLMSRAVRLPH